MIQYGTLSGLFRTLSPPIIKISTKELGIKIALPGAMVKVFSFYKNGIELEPVEVEVSLMKGLPNFQFMGQPDGAIKESELRIRSALKKQNFELPKGQQVLVNLKPLHIKKSSRGLELAVTAAYLWATGQIAQPREKKVYVYGEIGLDGKVYVPDDLDSLVHFDRETPIWSGFPHNSVGYTIKAIKYLTDLNGPQAIPGTDFYMEMDRPVPPDWKFSKKASRLMAATALGEHSLMLAGPAGSGKTTLATAIHHSLSDPTAEDFLMSQRIGKLVGQPHKWRPLVRPHHTTPPMSMIGGGSPAFPGEITRAHGGTLIMDEFLEFPSKVREALREPIEAGRIVVARRGVPQTYPAKFMLIGTTNLCPCGDLVPGKPTLCRFSLTRCRSYTERLSGPLLDRFEMLAYSSLWKGEKDTESIQDIRERVIEGRAFAKKCRDQFLPNQRLDERVIAETVEDFTWQELMPVDGYSRRRVKAVLKVARSLADLDQSLDIEIDHLEEALSYTLRPFDSMRRIFN